MLQRALQILRGIQVMLKQELHCALARFTSFAHSPNMPQKILRGNAAEFLAQPRVKPVRADVALFRWNKLQSADHRIGQGAP